MLLIHRIILKELLISFLFSILFLNFTFMVEKLIRITRILAGVGSSIFDIAKIILYIQPEILIVTIPMSLLLSVLITYGRMSSDNELIILRNTGMSFVKISKPIIYLGFLCFFLSILMSFYFGPKGSILLREKVSEILTKRAALTIEEGIFNTSFRDIVILVKEKTSQNRLKGLLIFDEREKNEQRIILANEGAMAVHGEGISFSLLKGQIYITKKNSLTEISFEKYQFVLIPTLTGYDKKKGEMTPFELLAATKTEPDQKNKYMTEYYRRFSMPALCLIIIFLSLPLALLSGKSGRLGGLTIGLAVFAVYYTILLYGENLAKTGQLPFLVGSWMAFSMLAITSIVLFYMGNKK